ncbi:MAG: hypothetical protein R3B07_25175 [Polyangiaceae bacterium]
MARPSSSPPPSKAKSTRPAKAAKESDASSGWQRFRRAAWRWTKRGLIAAPVVVVLLWIAVHTFPGLGPILADTLRAVIGKDAVTSIENKAYAVQDRFNQWWYGNEPPKAYWEVPAAADSALPEAPSATPDAGPPPLPPFRPADVGPVHKSWSAPGDGQWVPIKDAQHPEAETVMFKTLLHSDRNRSWAEVFVVAVDLRRVELHAMAGYQEPKSFEVAGSKYKRAAKIPTEELPRLLGAFNGGFKTEHGYYGMKIDGITLVKPRPKACTVAKFKDGALRIATWKTIEGIEDKMLWFRQAPGCMYEDGKRHPGLMDPDARAWGATLDGETVIRRSAIGLDEEGEVLYVAITKDTTARALADGMHHAGAVTVAQLDVNWSYPKFLLYEPVDGGTMLKAVPLAKGFEHKDDEYVGARSMRDFFYLTRKPDDG